MISTRSYYSPDIAVELCRRAGQGVPLPLPHSGQSDHHSDGNDDLHRRPSPCSEVDSKSNSGQARRRIAVACQRCRKRKIKCSGDLGNGLGCSNCRSAGTAPSACTFLRVNSREFDTFVTVRGVQGGGRYTPYPSNQSMATRSSALPVHTSNVGPSSYVNMPGGYDCYSGMYGPAITRASYPTYPVNYEDEMYNGQSPAYMLPNNNDSMLNNNILGPPASPRTWDVFASSGRSQGGLYSDQNPSSSISLPNGNFPGNSIPFASNAHEISSSFSGSSTVGSSMTSLDRILPNPAMARSQQPGLILTNSSLDGLSMSNIGYRSSIPWLGSEGMSCSSQSSDRVISASYGSSVDSNGGSDGSSATTQDTSFAYVPISHSPASAAMRTLPALSESGRLDDVRKPADSAKEDRARTLSEESTPSPDSHIAEAEAYGYSGDVDVVGRRSTRGSLPSGTLTNGQEYTRPRPLPTSTSELYGHSQADSPEYQSQIAHRTSIASLSGSARY